MESLIARIKGQVSLVDVVSEVVRLERRGRELVGLCCFHNDTRPSFALYAKTSNIYERFKCQSCGVGGDVIDFVKKYYGKSTREAAAFLASRTGRPSVGAGLVAPTPEPSSRQVWKADAKRSSLVVERYTIPRELMAGELVEQIRFEPKSFVWSRNGVWSLKGYRQSPPVDGDLDPSTFPPYMSWALSAERPIVICEGPKAATAARSMGLNAVGCYGVMIQPDEAQLAFARDREVILWPDADTAGREFMENLAQRLQTIAGTCRLLEWADAAPKEDAADFLRRYGVHSPRLAKQLLEGIE